MPKFGLGHNSQSLLDEAGDRKYMDRWERPRFYRCRYVITDLVERTLIELLYWTGARISEALELKVKSFDLRSSRITIRTKKQRGEKKNKTFRILKLPRLVMRRLNKVHRLKERQKYESREKDEFLWKNISRQQALELVKDICKVAGIGGTKATLMGLRHSFAVNMVMKRQAISAISQLFGHSDVETTMIYSTLRQNELDDVMRRSWSWIDLVS